MSNSLILFGNDLRLHDNAALRVANRDSETLLCLYVRPRWFKEAGRFGYLGAAKERTEFLEQSLQDLAASLQNLGQQLWILDQPSTPEIVSVIAEQNISHIVMSRSAGWYETTFFAHLQQQLKDCLFQIIDTHTLFKPEQLPFSLQELPSTFTKFRKAIEPLQPLSPEDTPKELAPPADLGAKSTSLLTRVIPSLRSNLPSSDHYFGGEQAALRHCAHYFSTSLPSSYKEVRNALDGFENSTKFSPWLANGSLSVRKIFSQLKQYQATNGENDSTYWIYFELLWREFFQWNANKLGRRLFLRGGSKKLSPLTSYYPERFQKWARGNTPYPLVNAIMRELLATGYISNRARQIVASCFVNELGLDWRYGAAWFESQLIDYDVASNWGNWQYLAGVGADVQPKRHFNLERQASQFDPNGIYTNKWGGVIKPMPLDSVDAADWPIA